MITQEILIRNMEDSKRITEKGIWYTEEEFASNILGRRNIVKEGLVLRFFRMANRTKKESSRMVLKNVAILNHT